MCSCWVIAWANIRINFIYVRSFIIYLTMFRVNCAQFVVYMASKGFCHVEVEQILLVHHVSAEIKAYIHAGLNFDT